METLTLCPTSTATILACQKIARTFKENIYELSSVRQEWDPEYADSLNAWIENTIEAHYSNPLEAITSDRYREWHEVMVTALQSLKVLRASVKIDFKNDKEFLKSFFEATGYNAYFSDAKNGDHLSLFNFLKTFAANLSESTRQKIVERGTVDAVFDKILACANRVNDFKDCFIALEGETALNDYGKKEVASIYSTIQDVCRVAIAYFQFDAEKRCQFNYYKVLVSL